MRFVSRFLVPATTAIVAVASAQTAAHAHYLWATVENGQARFALLEDLATPPSAQFAAYVSNLTPRCGGETLALGTVKDGARWAALPAGVAAERSVVSVDSTIGVTERGGPPYLLVYHVKGAASLAAAGEMVASPAEVLVRRDGDDLIVSLRQDGWPAPGGEVWVQWPGDPAPSSVVTDLKGEARVAWPKAAKPGFVGVRAMVQEARAGAVGGKSYASIRRWATLTFPVAQTPAADKPFSRVLRDAFGDNHEVVSEAAFNKTLFDGKLTRTQLEVHLQQRALIHNELHRILIAADPSRNVPYGPAQKSILTYLFSDLIAMGSGWPTEAQARPSTAAFLREIRDSEQRGPFFALGVQHVYFGGITNGGKLVGQQIAASLKIGLDYYAKSEGYPEYIARVNQITDASARAEMIKGGQAAYRYIIASSNEDVFRSTTNPKAAQK